jgi:hypothetical protein
MRSPRLRGHRSGSRCLPDEKRSALTDTDSSIETSSETSSSTKPQFLENWPTFEEILHRLHQEGIYIHSEQLAEFLLTHGLPVHLQYVPSHLQEKARVINENYQGDMARLEEF